MTKRWSDGGRPISLGLVAASPVHYQAPLYRRLAAHPKLNFEVIYLSTAGVRPDDLGYSAPVTWDSDLMGGYTSRLARRAHVNPSHGNFFRLHDFDIGPLVRRIEYDVLWIHGYNNLTHLLAAAAQKRLGRGLMFREEQTLLHPRPTWKRVVKSPALQLLFHGACALYIGSQNRKWFQSFGVPDDRLFFVPYCVENSELAAAAARLAPHRAALRERFGLKGRSEPVILMVGRLIPSKQPLVLLEAFARLRRDIPCSLIFVGSGSEEAAIRRRVRQLGLPGVRLAGFINQSELPEALSVADIFVLPSGLHETWGVAVNEAMNFSLPIVVTDKVGCAGDLVLEGQNGYIVPSDSVDSLAGALSRLVRFPELRWQMGRASAEIIQSWNYDAAVAGVVAASSRARVDHAR